MHFDSEASKHSFRHKFVFIAQDEIIVAVPVVFRLVWGEELRRDIGAGSVGNFVAEFEVLHELKEFVAHVGVLIVSPDCYKIGFGEVSKRFLNAWSVEDGVDGGGAPFGFEDDPVF